MFFKTCWRYPEAHNTGTQKWSCIVQYSSTNIWDLKYTFFQRRASIPLPTLEPSPTHFTLEALSNPSLPLALLKDPPTPSFTLLKHPSPKAHFLPQLPQVQQLPNPHSPYPANNITAVHIHYTRLGTDESRCCYQKSVPTDCRRCMSIATRVIRTAIRGGLHSKDNLWSTLYCPRSLYAVEREAPPLYL